MTRRDIDSLLRDWDEVARTARTPEPALRAGRVRARGGGSGLSVLPLLIVAAVVVAGIAVFARSAGGPGVGATPGASVAAIAPVSGSVEDGALRLTLSAERGTVAEGEAIDAVATVEYLGPGAALDVFTALDRIVFGVAEVGGDRRAGGGARWSCNPNTFARGVPVSYPWAKNAGYVPGDPAFAFEEWYATSGPALRLPAGTWRLSATFEGSEGGCGPSTHTLTAEVVVRVEPATAASVTPVPSAPSAGPPTPVVTCGQVDAFTCGGLLTMLAADHRDQLAAATRIVVDDTCPPASVCDRLHAFEAMVVVVPPEGIDAAVAYLATGKIREDGPDVIAPYTDPTPAFIAAQVVRAGAPPEPIPLLNLDPPPAEGTPAACPAALIDGRLIADLASGLAIQVDGELDSPVATVRWPFGFTARVDPLGYALVDDVGATIAHVGDRLQVGGGFGANDVWAACGGVTGVGGTEVP